MGTRHTGLERGGELVGALGTDHQGLAAGQRQQDAAIAGDVECLNRRHAADAPAAVFENRQATAILSTSGETTAPSRRILAR